MENLVCDSLLGSPDNKVVDLSSFHSKESHIQILSKGLSFSPKQNMEELTVFKDLNLILRKVLFRFLHEQKDKSPAACKILQEEVKKNRLKIFWPF